MRIEFPFVTLAYECASCLVGKLVGHTVKWIDNTSLYVQSRPAAYLALAGANIIFFEVALSICRIVNNLFSKYHDYDDLQHNEQWRRALSLGVFFTSILGGSILVFCKKLRLPLSNWNVVAVSSAIDLVYLCYKSEC